MGKPSVKAKPPVSAKRSKCSVSYVDSGSRQGRDPFARPGVGGNRWIRYGCDGEIPKKHRPKLEAAAKLAYDLNNKPAFVKKRDELVAKRARGKPLSYLDALDKMILNLAETSLDPVVKKEVKESLEAKRKDPSYEIEGGFMVLGTGRVFFREFALDGWTKEQLAGLIMHESCHVAGAPNDMLTEIVLSELYRLSYSPPTPD